MMRRIRVWIWRCQAVMPLPMFIGTVLTLVITAIAVAARVPNVDVDELMAKKRLLDVEVQTLSTQVRIFLDPPQRIPLPAAAGTAENVLTLALREQCGLRDSEYRFDSADGGVVRVTIDTLPMSGLCAVDSIARSLLSGSVLEARMNSDVFHLVWEGVDHG